MRKFLTFLSIGIFCLSIATKLDAQVITEIDSVSYLPVVVQNMNAVDSLRLVLTFNGHVINLREGFNINPALNGNKFSIDEYSDSIVIKWHSPIPATIAHDTLVNLRFWHYTGATKLLWNHASSFYHSSSGNLSAV